MTAPFLADLMLWLMYLMVAAAVAVTACSVWHGLKTSRRGDDLSGRIPAGRIGWCVVGGLVLMLVVTFLTGSASPVVSNGIPFTDRFWLKVTDMFIYTSTLLIIGCFASAIVSRFRS